MNMLVWFFRDHREAAEQAARYEVIRLNDLAAVTAHFEFPFAFPAEPRALAQYEVEADDGERVSARDVLAEAFLAAVPHEHGPPARETQTVRRDERVARTVPFEWVTFIEAPEARRYLSLPNDDSRVMRLSLFAHYRQSLRRISLDYGDGPGRPTGVSMAPRSACSLPVWGHCQDHECGGDCELKRVHDDSDGYVCRCPHAA